MLPITASMIFINTRNEILLQLRDDKPTIPFPNTWGIPGGHVESGETPEECIKREIIEELGIEVENFKLFSTISHTHNLDYVYWTYMDLDLEKISLTEGQCLKWFAKVETRRLSFAYDDDITVRLFFESQLISNNRAP